MRLQSLQASSVGQLRLGIAHSSNRVCHATTQINCGILLSNIILSYPDNLTVLIEFRLTLIDVLVRCLDFDLLLDLATEIIHFVFISMRHLLQLNIAILIHVKVIPYLIRILSRQRDPHTVNRRVKVFFVDFTFASLVHKSEHLSHIAMLVLNP